MSFAAYRRPQKSVEATKGLGIGDIQIRPLNEGDISVIYAVHAAGIETVFRSLMADETKPTAAMAGDNAAAISFVIRDIPTLAVDIIAAATGFDNPDERAGIASLPFSVKVDILKEIVAFSLEAEGGLEKLIGFLPAAAKNLLAAGSLRVLQ